MYVYISYIYTVYTLYDIVCVTYIYDTAPYMMYIPIFFFSDVDSWWYRSLIGGLVSADGKIFELDYAFDVPWIVETGKIPRMLRW